MRKYYQAGLSLHVMRKKYGCHERSIKPFLGIGSATPAEADSVPAHQYRGYGR